MQTYEGRQQPPVRAWAFTSSPSALLPAEVVPTEAYMRCVREGAADQFLDPGYQAWLSGIETVSSAGLPAEYFNTPSEKGKGVLGIAAAVLLVAAFVATFRIIGA